jgi:hypothetical protein
MPTAHLRIETLRSVVLRDRIVLNGKWNQCLAFLDFADYLKPLDLGQMFPQLVPMTLESAINLVGKTPVLG